MLNQLLYRLCSNYEIREKFSPSKVSHHYTVSLFSAVAMDGYIHSIKFCSCTCTVDALYEAAGKRTFLAMIVDFLLGVPVLIGLLLFYKHLQPEEQSYRELSHSSDTDSSSSSLLSSSPSSESDVEGGLELTSMQSIAKGKNEDLAMPGRTSDATSVATIIV